MTTEHEALEEYARMELARLEIQRQEAIKAKGGLPYLGSLPIGETFLDLQAKIPTDNEDQNGQLRKQFTVKKTGGDGEALAWTVNPRSPLYRDLLGVLPQAPVTIKLVRTGEGRSDTRYSLKLEKKL